MMIDLKSYKGIEYIHLYDLPQRQRQILLETIDHDLFIKILVDGKIVSQCLQYKDYAYWYKNIYDVKARTTPREEPAAQPIAMDSKLVFK
jgi:hypothetical protein